jgi:glutamine amidotransferase
MHHVVGTDDGDMLGFLYILSDANGILLALRETAPKSDPVIDALTPQFPSLEWHERELVDLIKACTQPVLGICLGMQLLGRRSEESNGVDLLGIIDEDVPKMTDHGLPLPHMGWNRVYAKAGDRLFRGIEDGAYFYFVHSYAMPVNVNTIAQCNYGEAFTAAVQKDNFFGVQFHPERSGAAGAQLLKNFLEM